MGTLEIEELERTLASWHKTIDEGKADEFIQSCEEHRMQIGSSTSIVGYKWTGIHFLYRYVFIWKI